MKSAHKRVRDIGKTVQCVAACMLRNALALAQERPRKPTLIVSPNDAVSTQWFETLIKANVAPNKIYRYRAKSQVHPTPRHEFYLCNRYDLQTEARHCFDRLKTEKAQFRNHKSPLFPNAPISLLKCLQNQYLSEQGKAQNWFKQGERNSDEDLPDRIGTSEIITKSLSKFVGEIDTVFETVVIDEAVSIRQTTELRQFWNRSPYVRYSLTVALFEGKRSWITIASIVVLYSGEGINCSLLVNC